MSRHGYALPATTIVIGLLAEGPVFTSLERFAVRRRVCSTGSLARHLRRE
jgi:hypothetical protein